ncbi:ATP-dependent protease LonB [Pueribacillus theae]|uniref:endopeptidase La n=1 Tax=Pueribacillus theae TaxID=2171751 RepID=A0A2U1JN37_9BACI|nr:ATP-dependent protease LonB [Pueribacillus theae]PWA06399.1 ATP-dependent protease LonB [Pueribacillus theae]
MNWTVLAVVVQLFFGVVIGLYFWNLLRNQRTQRVSIDKESKKEMEQLRRMRNISLTKPLSEKIRPSSFKEVIGQEDGIKALKAAICGPNPQHVIIYGPPGVGKTAAARLVLEEAKRNKNSPFRYDAVFVELDATTARFDERGIADPLIGAVHDPLYQGAGAMGQAGIPQPKQGAVTKAHGGVLFIDEIGELHPIQMNKLLKVLEDRKVFLESAYYSEENQSIPDYIHDIFKNGLPADFRLIGATTRSAEEIPPAIRSRCLEVFFRELTQSEIALIAKKAAVKIKCDISDEAVDMVTKYTRNGRETVNVIQIAAGVASADGRKVIQLEDIEWVVYSSQLSPRPEKKVNEEGEVGIVNGLAVYGPNTGALLEIEATVCKAKGERGEVTITGIVEEESIGNSSKSIRRKSLAKSSVENVLTVLQKRGINASKYDIHINFPGGTPVDGPSAGIAMATAIVSAINNNVVHSKTAMTGEISIHGKVKPVGGIFAKVKAAKEAGATRVIIPRENDQEMLKQIKGIEIIPVSDFVEVLDLVLLPNHGEIKSNIVPAVSGLHGAPTRKI